MTKPTALYQCPDCNHPPYKDPRGLSSHRRSAHNVVGASAAARHARDKKKGKPAQKGGIVDRLRGSYPCPHCDFVAKWSGGLTHHINKRHAALTTPQENKIVRTKKAVTLEATDPAPHQEQGHSDAIPDALVAIASGRFTEVCRSMAFEFDLPPRSFAARVAAFVYASQVR